MTPKVGTIAYMAPELYNPDGKYSNKIDVYSFAVLLWEMITREEPFSDISFIYEIAERVQAGERPIIPPHCPSIISSLINDCWVSEPNKRPSFAQIYERLVQIGNIWDQMQVEQILADMTTDTEGFETISSGKERNECLTDYEDVPFDEEELLMIHNSAASINSSTSSVISPASISSIRALSSSSSPSSDKMLALVYSNLEPSELEADGSSSGDEKSVRYRSLKKTAKVRNFRSKSSEQHEPSGIAASDDDSSIPPRLQYLISRAEHRKTAEQKTLPSAVVLETTSRPFLSSLSSPSSHKSSFTTQSPGTSSSSAPSSPQRTQGAVMSIASELKQSEDEQEDMREQEEDSPVLIVSPSSPIKSADRTDKGEHEEDDSYDESGDETDYTSSHESSHSSVSDLLQALKTPSSSPNPLSQSSPSPVCDSTVAPSRKRKKRREKSSEEAVSSSVHPPKPKKKRLRKKPIASGSSERLQVKDDETMDSSSQESPKLRKVRSRSKSPQNSTKSLPSVMVIRPITDSSVSEAIAATAAEAEALSIAASTSETSPPVTSKSETECESSNLSPLASRSFSAPRRIGNEGHDRRGNVSMLQSLSKRKVDLQSLLVETSSFSDSSHEPTALVIQVLRTSLNKEVNRSKRLKQNLEFMTEKFKTERKERFLLDQKMTGLQQRLTMHLTASTSSLPSPRAGSGDEQPTDFSTSFCNPDSLSFLRGKRSHSFQDRYNRHIHAKATRNKCIEIEYSELEHMASAPYRYSQFAVWYKARYLGFPVSVCVIIGGINPTQLEDFKETIGKAQTVCNHQFISSLVGITCKSPNYSIVFNDREDEISLHEYLVAKRLSLSRAKNSPPVLSSSSSDSQLVSQDISFAAKLELSVQLASALVHCHNQDLILGELSSHHVFVYSLSLSISVSPSRSLTSWISFFFLLFHLYDRSTGNSVISLAFLSLVMFQDSHGESIPRGIEFGGRLQKSPLKELLPLKRAISMSLEFWFGRSSQKENPTKG